MGSTYLFQCTNNDYLGLGTEDRQALMVGEMTTISCDTCKALYLTPSNNLECPDDKTHPVKEWSYPSGKCPACGGEVIKPQKTPFAFID